MKETSDICTTLLLVVDKIKASTPRESHSELSPAMRALVRGCILCLFLSLVLISLARWNASTVMTNEDRSERHGRALTSVPVGPGVFLNAIIQPTTFLRVALLILRNSIGDNPTSEFLQMILATDLGRTRFSNVFASFASGIIQDFSVGMTKDTAIAQQWVIDGDTTLESTVFSEAFSGAAVGVEQFFGMGFELSSAASLAIQQSLQPKDYDYDYHYDASGADDGATRRRRRRLLSAKEAKARKLPAGSEVVLQVQHPLNQTTMRKAIKASMDGSSRDVDRTASEHRGRRLLEDASNTEVTYDDVEFLTTNWFESFPAALPLAIRDRFIALLEEYIVDPQLRISLDITVAMVSVATPGVGITSYESAAENTISSQVVFHGYDAAIDFATSIDPAVAVAGSISKGVAIANAIDDATKILDAVTAIIDEVNAIVEEDALARQGNVTSQSGGGGGESRFNETTMQKLLELIRPLNETYINRPTGVDTSRAMHFTNMGQNTSAPRTENSTTTEEDDYVSDYAAGGDYFYDYEPLGAVSGTYAVAVSLIFLEQVSLNGGSITVI